MTSEQDKMGERGLIGTRVRTVRSPRQEKKKEKGKRKTARGSDNRRNLTPLSPKQVKYLRANIIREPDRPNITSRCKHVAIF